MDKSALGVVSGTIEAVTAVYGIMSAAAVYSSVSSMKSSNQQVNAEGGNGDKGGNYSSERPTWRQSELDAAKDFPEYSEQKSFLNGEEVPYGTKGSVRPDLFKEGFSIDVKNYNIETASGRSNLARNIEKQYYQRLSYLPEGTNRSVLIDIRGQNVSQDNISELYKDIMERTNNGIKVIFKTN